MILVDTSIWIEFFRGNQPFFDSVSALLGDRQIITASCVFGELLQGARSSKERALIKEFWVDLPKVSLQAYENAWIQGGDFSSEERFYARGVGLIDSALLVLAKVDNYRLWTLDKEVAKIATRWKVNFQSE